MTNEQKLRQWIIELRDDAADYGKENGKITKGYVWAGAIYQEALRVLAETDQPTMTADEYQQLAARTLIGAPDAAYSPADIMLVWNALGLAGEAGEVADTIKKAVFHQHGVDREELIKELGDVLWYVAALCTKLDVSLAEVMTRNIEKLKRRYPDGYSSGDSKKRVDVVKE